MDGVAAVEARIGEIQQRMAQFGITASASPGRFGAVLATAMERRSSAVTGSAGSASEGSARMDLWLEQAIAVTGVPATWAPALKTIAQHESGFNPAAVNGNDPVGGGKYQRVVGLMQMLPSTFAAHAAPGHADIHNPVDNLIAAIRYIQRRYGDPSNTPGLRSMARGGPYRGY